MVNERITDDFISSLLRDANIDYIPNGSNIKEINDALSTASKRGTGRAGFPEFTAKSDNFIIIRPFFLLSSSYGFSICHFPSSYLVSSLLICIFVDKTFEKC